MGATLLCKVKRESKYTTIDNNNHRTDGHEHKIFLFSSKCQLDSVIEGILLLSIEKCLWQSSVLYGLHMINHYNYIYNY